jgi:hypothetical protein
MSKRAAKEQEVASERVAITKADVVQALRANPARIPRRIETHVEVCALAGIGDVDAPVLIDVTQPISEPSDILCDGVRALCDSGSFCLGAVWCCERDVRESRHVRAVVAEPSVGLPKKERDLPVVPKDTQSAVMGGGLRVRGL